MPKRNRNVQLNFRVSKDEKEWIEKKMEAAGVINREAYLRKMAMDGYILKLDLPELKEIISLMRRMSNNINQIAKRMNEQGGRMKRTYRRSFGIRKDYGMEFENCSRD